MATKMPLKEWSFVTNIASLIKIPLTFLSYHIIVVMQRSLLPAFSEMSLGNS